MDDRARTHGDRSEGPRCCRPTRTSATTGTPMRIEQHVRDDWKYEEEPSALPRIAQPVDVEKHYLEDALRHLRARSAPGPDNITYTAQAILAQVTAQVT